MLVTTRYLNLRLKKYLIESPKKKIIWVKDNNMKMYTGACNIFIGINKPHNFCKYNELCHFIDYNYNISIANNIKLSPNFYIEQYEFRPVHNKIDRYYQMNIMNKIIFNQMQNSESHLEHIENIPNYKFVYFYQMDKDLEFYYNFLYKKEYHPKEDDILLFENNISSHYVYKPLNINLGENFPATHTTIGIMIMNVQKIL